MTDYQNTSPLKPTSNQQENSTSKSDTISPHKLVCPCKMNEQLFQTTKNPTKVINCTTCNWSQHEHCIREAVKIKRYQCPSCQLKESDPYIKVVQTLMQPLLIKNEGVDMKVQMSFQISPEVSKAVMNIKVNTNQVYIMIRCLRLDNEGYEHHWPFNCSVSLNGVNLKSFTLPKYPPRSRSRMDYPIVFYNKIDDISLNNNYHNLNKDHMFPMAKTINFSPTAKNILETKSEFKKNDNDKYSYCISVDLVEVIRDTEEVISKIPVITDLSHLRTLFKNEENSSENERLVFSEKVSLLDCYTRSQKIKLPARSINCSHMAVFDLKYYLMINRKNKSYDCPLCRKKATRLYVDGHVKKVIDDNKDLEEVMLNPDYEEVNNVTSCREENNSNNLNQTSVCKRASGSGSFYGSGNLGIIIKSQVKANETVVDLEDDAMAVDDEINTPKEKKDKAPFLVSGSESKKTINVNLTSPAALSKNLNMEGNTNTANSIPKTNSNQNKSVKNGAICPNEPEYKEAHSKQTESIHLSISKSKFTYNNY